MRRMIAILSLLCCGLAVLIAGPPADAAIRPSVTLHPISSRITAKGHSTYEYHAANLRHGSRVVLEVREHSTWVELARSAPRRGAGSGRFRIAGPGEPGRFSFRTAVLRRGRVVATSGSHLIYAYGKVSLNTLCHGVLDGDCESGDRHLDDGSNFHYVLLTGVDEPSDPFSAQIGAAAISCRSITLNYISDSQDSTTTYLELRQTGRRPQKHTSPSAKVGTFSPVLTGKKFGVSVEQDAAQVFMYFNGSASCYTATGKP